MSAPETDGRQRDDSLTARDIIRALPHLVRHLPELWAEVRGPRIQDLTGDELRARLYLHYRIQRDTLIVFLALSGLVLLALCTMWMWLP